jgi:hypothetical protein
VPHGFAVDDVAAEEKTNPFAPNVLSHWRVTTRLDVPVLYSPDFSHGILRAALRVDIASGATARVPGSSLPRSPGDVARGITAPRGAVGARGRIQFVGPLPTGTVGAGGVEMARWPDFSNRGEAGLEGRLLFDEL